MSCQPLKTSPGLTPSDNFENDETRTLQQLQTIQWGTENTEENTFKIWPNFLGHGNPRIY